MTEIVNLIIDKLKSFFDLILQLIKKRHERRSLRDSIQQYIRRKRKQFEENNLDYFGLLNYANGKLLNDVYSYLDQTTYQGHKSLRNTIVAKIKHHLCDKNNVLSEQITDDILEIAVAFYSSKMDFASKASMMQAINPIYRQMENMPIKLNAQTQSMHLVTQPADYPHYLTLKPTPISLEQVIGRASIISNICNVMPEKKPVLVSGMAGIGKTCVVQAVFHILENQYDYVAWLQYSGCIKDTFLRSFRLFDEITDENERYQKIKSFLQKHPNTLIVLDNVDKDSVEDKEINEVSCCGVSTIITSTIEVFDPFTLFYLDALCNEDAEELFYSYYGRDNDRKEKEIVRQILLRIHNHTYLIELLAKAARLEYNLETYYEKLDRCGFSALTIKIASLHTRERQTVSDHLRILFQLGKYSSEENRILQNFALMPSIDIPSDIISIITTDINSLDNLVRHGLLSINEISGVLYYYMQPLLKESILLSPLMDNTGIEVVKRMAHSVYADVDKEYSVSVRKYDIIASIFDGIRVYWTDWYTEDMGCAVNNLGYLYLMKGVCEKAKHYFRWALKIKNTIDGSDITIADVYSNLSEIYRTQHNYKKALRYSKQQENILKINDARISMRAVSLYNNRAAIYKDQGDDENWYKNLYIALEIFAKNPHQEDDLEYELHLCSLMNNLSVALIESGEDKTALSYLKHMAEHTEQFLGAYHPDTALAKLNYGFALCKNGMGEKAKSYIEDGLHVCEDVLGKDHPNTVIAYKNLGMLYYNLGDFRPALNYYIRAKDILEKHPKNQQLELAQIYINIGEILYSLEEYSESVAYFSNAFTIRLKELGQESELTQQALNYSLIAFDSAPKYLMKVDGTIIETKDVEITV